ASRCSAPGMPRVLKSSAYPRAVDVMRPASWRPRARPRSAWVGADSRTASTRVRWGRVLIGGLLGRGPPILGMAWQPARRAGPWCETGAVDLALAFAVFFLAAAAHAVTGFGYVLLAVP